MHRARLRRDTVARAQVVSVVIIRPGILPLVRHLRDHPGVARKYVLRLYRPVPDREVLPRVEGLAVFPPLDRPDAPVVIGVEGFVAPVKRLCHPVLLVPGDPPVD